jgi:tellurite resistance protein
MRRLTISCQACIETLALLVTMAWADGRLEDSEKAGVLAAAGVLNLTKEMRDRLDEVLKKPVPVDQILFETLSARDRAFAYVAAAWMASVDEHIDPKEEEVLARAAAMMGYSAARRAELEAIARDLEPPGEGGRKWEQEIERLFRAIPAKLEEAPPEEIEVVFA